MRDKGRDAALQFQDEGFGEFGGSSTWRRRTGQKTRRMHSRKTPHAAFSALPRPLPAPSSSSSSLVGEKEREKKERKEKDANCTCLVFGIPQRAERFLVERECEIFLFFFLLRA